jgi:uncharacterized membrane protein YeaQ/YmgE (transglycosylase-associated protein family)
MSLCSLVGWAFFGLFIGAIARLLWPGQQRMGLTMTMFVGVVGSVVGGLITQMLMGAADEPYHPAGWIMSIVGAILVLWLCGVGRDRSSP